MPDPTAPTEPGTGSPVLPWLFRRVPALDSLRTYSPSALARDLTAGLTVATVAVPQAMAYAMLAGLPPQYGLYTAIVMTAVGALLDSSRLLINGPTNAISVALLSALLPVAEAERIPAAVVIAFLVGLVQLGIFLLRLGDLTRYVSHSVIVGFTLGASVLLILDQTKHLLGLTPRGDPADHFLTRFWLTVTGGLAHAPTVAVGAGTILVVLLVRKLNRMLKRRKYRFPIPQHLVAVVAAGLAVWALGLDKEGVKIVGDVPSALPSFHWPELTWERARVLAGSAFALAILGLLEALAMAKSLAAKTGQRLDVNQQCLSEGAANLAGSFFQCFPGSGSLTRSAVNEQSGAVSQWSGVFAAVAVAATVALFAPLAAYIPRASLAGLLILAGYRMVDGRQLRFHLRTTKFDAGVVAATAFAAVFISIEFCILAGVFLSFALYMPKAAQVRLTRFPAMPDGSYPEPSATTLAFELEGELFFGAEEELARHFAAMADTIRPETHTVLLYLSRGRNPDAGFLMLLRDFHAVIHRRGVRLMLAGVQPELRAALHSSGVGARLGWE